VSHPLARFRPQLSWGILVECILAGVVYAILRASFEFAALSKFLETTVDLWTALVGVLFGGALAAWAAFAAAVAGPFGEYLEHEGKLRAFSTVFLIAAAVFYASTVLLIVAKGVDVAWFRHCAIVAIVYSLANGITLLTNSAHVLVMHSGFQREYRDAMSQLEREKKDGLGR